MTEWLHFHFSLSCTGEGNGNPLQCSCLENPRDGGAWCTTVSGVTQSQTQLKWRSSSSGNHHLYITTKSHLPLLYIAAIIIFIILYHQNHHSPPHYHQSIITTFVIFTSLSSPFYKFLVTSACQVASVMSDSVQPHGLQPTRLLCPWDSPGKNTGVGLPFPSPLWLLALGKYLRNSLKFLLDQAFQSRLGFIYSGGSFILSSPLGGRASVLWVNWILSTVSN